MPANPKEEKVRVEGRVAAVLPNTKYLIEIEVVGVKHQLTGYISGKMRKNYIKIAEGDEVVVEISPNYNLDIGRIVYKKDRRFAGSAMAATTPVAAPVTAEPVAVAA